MYVHVLERDRPCQRPREILGRLRPFLTCDFWSEPSVQVVMMGRLVLAWSELLWHRAPVLYLDTLPCLRPQGRRFVRG